MAVRFTVEQRATALVRAQRAGIKILEITESQNCGIVFPVLDIELRVVVVNSKRQRMPAHNPVVFRRALKLVLKDTGIREVRRRAEFHLISLQRRHDTRSRFSSHIGVVNVYPGEEISAWQR